jgi:hypothetical protein
LALDQFDGQVFQRGVIELKLPLEGAIGDAAPLAQQNDCLIHHRDKVHPAPPSLLLPLRMTHLHHSIGDGAGAGGRIEPCSFHSSPLS